MKGKQAVDLVVAEQSDLILLDMVLPDLDGLEIARQVRQHPKTQDARPPHTRHDSQSE